MKQLLIFASAFIVLISLTTSCKKNKPLEEEKEDYVDIEIGFKKNSYPNKDGYIIESGKMEVAIILNGTNEKKPEIILRKRISFGETVPVKFPKRNDRSYTIIATNTEFLVGISAEGIVSTNVEALYKNLPDIVNTPYFILKERRNTYNDIPSVQNYWDFKLTSPYIYKRSNGQYSQIQLP